MPTSPKSRSRKTRMAKLCLLMGAVLTLLGVYTVAYRPFESATIFHPAEQQYGIRLLSLESANSTADYSRVTKVVLEVIDRSQPAQFAKFKQIEDLLNGPTKDPEEYGQRRSEIRLQKIRKD